MDYNRKRFYERVQNKDGFSHDIYEYKKINNGKDCEKNALIVDAIIIKIEGLITQLSDFLLSRLK